MRLRGEASTAAAPLTATKRDVKETIVVDERLIVGGGEDDLVGLAMSLYRCRTQDD